MNLSFSCVDGLHRDSLLELEDKSCSDILDNSRSAWLFPLLKVSDVLVALLIDPFHDPASKSTWLLWIKDIFLSNEDSRSLGSTKKFVRGEEHSIFVGKMLVFRVDRGEAMKTYKVMSNSIHVNRRIWSDGGVVKTGDHSMLMAHDSHSVDISQSPSNVASGCYGRHLERIVVFVLVQKFLESFVV